MQNLIQNLLLLIFVTPINTATTELRIVGGRLAKNGEFPYQASIRMSYNDQHTCGGTIISPKHILTAAHCMYYGWGGQFPPFILSVVVGQLQLSTTSSSIYRNVSKIFVNPGYDKEDMSNDIAILELDREIPNNNILISEIPLNKRIIDTNTLCTVSGWGVLKYGLLTLNKELLAADVFLIDHDECQRRYDVINTSLEKGMMCAVNDLRPADACQGDSGGPLVCDGRLTGVVSVGKGCANKKFPGIYSDVRFFLPWIEETIGIKLATAEAATSKVESSFEKATTLVPAVTTVKVLQTNEFSNILSTSPISEVKKIFLAIYVFWSVFKNLL